MQDPRHFNETMVADLRAHAGVSTQGPMAGRRLMVLTTTGARSGRGAPRPSPIRAMATRTWSSPRRAARRRTLPGTTTSSPAPWSPSRWMATSFQARATVVHGAERRRLYDAQAALMPGFAEYEQRTERVIPVVRLERDA